MAINNAAKKAKASAKKISREASSGKPQSVAPLSEHVDRSATLRLYIKDKTLLKEAKMAAFEDETSLSQLWEEWAISWLESR